MRRLAAALLLAGAAGQYDPDACESWCARSFPYTYDESDGDDDAWERQSGLSVPPARAAPPRKERAPKPKQKKVEYYL